MSACVEVKNLKKYFDTPAGRLHAVDDISLKIEKGTTMGVVGESGCGKSTLGRTIVHLQDSTEGQIFLNGEDITHVQGKQLKRLHEKMQIIFQDPYSSLNPRMTIGETIQEPLMLSKRFSKADLEKEVTKLMDKAGIEVGKTPWMWKDNLASWTWPGYEGETASVDVYANADEAELFLNGESLGRKSIGGVYVVTYEVPYHPGKLEAVNYLNGVEAGRAVLQTAGKAVKLKVEADRNELPADGESLTFVKIRLEDAAGNFNRRESAAVTIKVEGCAALQGFGSADPSCEGSYQSHTWNTYDGSVMAVIRAAKCSGKAVVTISAVNFAEEKLVLNIK